MDKNKTLLTIALLASNRADTIQKCLDSLTPIREAISTQLVILDTGCSRELRQLLERYGDVVADFTWCNDFSRARNETLKYATGDWYMYLDDDEWFVDVQELIDFFVSGEYRDYGRASYIQRNFLDMEASQYTDSWVSRMTKRVPETRFVSKIHEYMEPSQGNCKGLKAVVHHFGYVYETEEALWKHFERNRPLLEEMIAEEPDNLRWRIQLAQEYRSVREYDRLYALGEECLALTAEHNEMYDNIALGGFYGAKIIACREQKRYEECLALCRAARQDKRNTELCLAFLALNAARSCFYLEDYAGAEREAAEYLRWKDFFAENEPILYLQKPVPFVGECLDIVMIKEGYSLLICSGLMLNKTAYLERYLDKLEWGSGHIYVFEEMVPTLVDAMCRLTRVPAFDRAVCAMHENTALWEYFCEQLTGYERAGNRVTPVMDIIREVVPEALASEEESVVGSSAGASGAGGASNGELEVGGVFEGAPKAVGECASQEMEALAAGIREQLRLLLDKGLYAEAAQVFAQVRRLLPEDEELLSLEQEIRAHSENS